MASRAMFPVYRGEQPYIFVSYAHADSADVLPIAAELHRRRYRVWYDEGIEAGTKWPEYIATHMLKASTVLFFSSELFNTSHNCEREVNFAVDAKKNMTRVALDDSELSPGLKMQLSTAGEIRSTGNPAETADLLIRSGALDQELIGDGVEGYEAAGGRAKRRANAALIVGVVGVMLAFLFGLALLGFTRGWFGEKSGMSRSTVTMAPESADGETVSFEVTSWNNPVMRDLLISQTEGEALYCCGNAFVTARSGIDYKNGLFLVAGSAVDRGDISDLEPVAKLTNLVELALCYESITDVSALGALQNLAYLDLSGNEIADFSSIKSLGNLSVLKLSHTGVQDLTPALNLSGLKKLYVSYDMASYIKPILKGDFEIIVTE